MEAKTGRTGQISALKLQSSEVGDPKELRRREERLWEKLRLENMTSDPRDDIVNILNRYIKKLGSKDFYEKWQK